MAGAKLDPEIVAHLEWLGFVRPTGLVVSAPALVRAGAILDRRDAEGQRLLRACVEERAFDPKEGPVTVPARLPPLRGVCPRLELLAEGVRRYDRVPDPDRARGAAAGLRRDASARLRRPRA